MGYTHYYRNKPAFTDEQWSAFCVEVRQLFQSYRGVVALGNGHGEPLSSPYIGRDEIAFNGIDDDSHETAFVSKFRDEFQFCKTARKPYDEVVVKFYKLIRKYLPTTELMSDGGIEIFGGRKIMVNNKWTYLTGGYEVAVGDTVILPHGHRNGKKYSDGTWEGTVTRMGSKYDGECKTILGVVAKGPLDHVDPDAQITTEEGIAAMLNEDYGLDEEDAAAASRKALLIVANRLGIK